ncbi:4'-phosphopantetheinyl transferase superfamily protein [uncultured Winogradskyella sp.]|uniref:4'-phosphopantetheinyl transferase family protein n=1 Tax=uncultured Winogradskyella sp. TaxID=395353 RepID=UPI0026302A13|nr:4'-phosphopantetheinyl transferase superfamily protein [uncultured Winogradskyella sp.]
MIKLTESLFNLEPNTVHIWSFDFNIEDEAVKKYFHLLSQDEQARANKFKFDKDRRCYVVSKGVLRTLSGKYLNRNAQDIMFSYGEFGKPKFEQNTDLNFNVSHSGDLATIGFVTNHTIGIDIEKIKNDFDTFEIASNFFSKKEIADLQLISKPEQYIAFYRCWTRKEALIKAIGSGLSFPLDSFSVTLDHDFIAEMQETHWDKSEKKEWNFHTFKPRAEYIAAVIVKNNFCSFKTMELDPTNLI